MVYSDGLAAGVDTKQLLEVFRSAGTENPDNHLVSHFQHLTHSHMLIQPVDSATVSSNHYLLAAVCSYILTMLVINPCKTFRIDFVASFLCTSD